MRLLAAAFAAFAASVLTLAPQLAQADPTDWGVGARVGGYGFREPSTGSTSNHGHSGWEDCRMNGIGLFGQRRVGPNLFLQAGLDQYFAESFPMSPTEHDEMDRRSTLFSVGGGFRMWPEARVSPYVEIGGGLELTHVAMPGGVMTHEESRALPFGFLGFGGDLRLGDHIKLGANLRVATMGHFEHDHALAADLDGHGMEVDAELAAQGQFYARYDL